MVFKEDSVLITKGKEGNIKVWEIGGDYVRCVKTLNHDSDTDIKISDDLSHVLIGCNDGNLHLYRTNDWGMI